MRASHHPFTLRQLQYAAAVADLRSFRRAAERCHVSQPSLSAQVIQLEEQLGVRLFERASRRVIVTAAGEAVLTRLRRLLLEADDLADSVRQLGDPLAGTLRLGVIPTVSPYLLPEIVPELRARHPALSAVWVEDKTENLIEALREGRIDGALLALEAPLGEVEKEIVCEDPFVLAAPPGHPLVQSERRRPRPRICAAPASCSSTTATASATRRSPTARRPGGASSTSAPRASPRWPRWSRAAPGVTLLPRLSLPVENRRSELAVRRLSSPAPHRTLALVWRPRSPLGPALRRLAVTIREACAGAEARLEAAVGGKGPRRARAPAGRKGAP